MPNALTHLTPTGDAHMVDVGDKSVTRRVAVARGRVLLLPETITCIRDGNVPKGDLFAVARIAGIMAAKRTSELIPLCHPLQLTKVEVDLTLTDSAMEIEATVACAGKTGVEMEALTAVSVAALTVYDMVKAIDRSATIQDIQLVHKSGGKSGAFFRVEPEAESHDG